MLVPGAFALLMPLSAYIIRKHGSRTPAAWARYCSLFMFLTSAAYWAASVATLGIRLHAFFIKPSPPLAAASAVYSPIPNSVVLINYILSDGVVVWRAWVLCRRDSGRLLYVPVVLLCSASLAVIATCVMRIIITVVRVHYDLKIEPAPLTRGIDVCQVASISLTLLNNLTATGLIGYQAWKYRREVQGYISAAADNGRGTASVLALMIESGLLYCLSTVFMIVAMTIRLPYGTLGDLYTPVNVQLAGMYPTLVILIVSLRMSVQESTMDARSREATRQSTPGTTPSIPLARGGPTISNDQSHITQ
ncbi:hypothetical protein AURDEDRAFT_188167 [Auricularia subglabra TFB-10046 SS5]|uniref:Uncharacterized protein n=1 Tax=Auricularia subglabra (strain TFB-10046 / SS5) TaxID=717982 RepID=J0CZK5_AURST|nr:hypothetical protein AURDEDRAFT_188167 [Auricularia subglabra TFB-10046 SS5]